VIPTDRKDAMTDSRSGWLPGGHYSGDTPASELKPPTSGVKRGGYPGSGDGPTMPPPPPNPSGSPPAGDVSDAFTWSDPTHGDLNVTYTGRILDPVRAHALAQAVNHVGVNGVEGDDVPGEVLAVAERFAEWLVGPESEAP
jgi:hypothetical protein